MLRYACLLGILAMTTAHPAMAQSDAEMKACVDQSGGYTWKMLDCGKTEIDKFAGVELTIDGHTNIKVNKAQIVTADMVASNGVIHVIDAVLMPPKA